MLETRWTGSVDRDRDRGRIQLVDIIYICCGGCWEAGLRGEFWGLGR